MVPGITDDQEKTGRLYVRLPEESIRELGLYIERSGATRSQFLALAVMLGARALDRALNPLENVPASMVEHMSEQMTAVLMRPENLEKMMKMAVSDSLADEAG